MVKENMKREREDEIEYESFQPKTLEDFEKYNKWARQNKRRVKVPTEEFHKKVKVKFQRFDQPENVLKARVRNKDIDWTGQLIPGGIYDLPLPVVKFLNSLSTPKYAEVKVDKGGETITETQKVGEIQRFSCQLMEYA